MQTNKMTENHTYDNQLNILIMVFPNTAVYADRRDWMRSHHQQQVAIIPVSHDDNKINDLGSLVKFSRAKQQCSIDIKMFFVYISVILNMF